MTRLIVVGLALACLATQDRPVFKSASRTVTVYATVQGRDGRLVPDLQRDEFSVLDNGKPAPITVFDNTPQKITLVAMFDMSGSMNSVHSRLRDASRAFIGALWPDDRVRLGSFGGEVALSAHLTSDKTILRRVVDEEFWPGDGTPLWFALNAAMTSIEDQPGRRVVLTLTDGKDTDVAVRRGSALGVDRDRVRRHGETGDFMVYVIGLQGAEPARDILDLADDTGGGRFEVARDADLGQLFARVVEELHHQYVIGFDQATDGRRHTIQIKVTRPGARIRAKKSYVADATENPR